MKPRTFILPATVVCCIAVIGILQSDLHRTTGTKWQQESMTYLPGGSNSKDAFLGFEMTVAHYLWIRMILYFGGHTMTDKQYPWLVDMIDIITRLCPWFYQPYEFAGLMIPDVCDDPGAARVILERGLTYLGVKRWNIAFYMGMIYYKYYDDRQTAADYFARAAMVPSKHRAKLATLAHSFYKKAGSPQEGWRFLSFVYETSENPDVRRHLAQKMKDMSLQQ